MTGTWYPPSLGTGGVLIEAQLFTNPPFKMTEHDPTGRSAEGAQPIEPTERTIMVPLQTPVPISERLPGPEDCDAEGKCWVGYPEWTYGIADTGDTDATTPEWRLERPPLKPKGSRCWWLPAHALPLPQGEVDE